MIKFARFQAELQDWSGSRLKRQLKKVIRQTLQREGYRLKHYSVIQKSVELWYKCLVNPGSIEEYLDEHSRQSETDQERSNVETTIARKMLTESISGS
ncbi:hypothetical protein ACFLUS_05700 [Chloroflexota bacterium]